MLRLLLLVAVPALATEAWTFDPAVGALVDDALASRPELEEARAEVTAAAARVPQAKAWPDPMLQVGVQNDGFRRWQVGVNEMSWVSVMASQTIPFPGKPSLAAAVAEARASQTQAAVERARLSIIADVQRSAVELQLLRARLEQLGALEKLVAQAAALAQVRQESADGMQADVLRARLEVGRLAQRRRSLERESANALRALNRARGKPLDSPVVLPPLEAVLLPARLDGSSAGAPELDAARAGRRAAEHGVELAGTTGLPDLSVSAGVMVRGSLEPMWSLSLGAPLPVSGLPRRAQALDEARASLLAAERRVDDVTQRLALADEQRALSFDSLVAQLEQARALVNDARTATAATLTAFQTNRAPLTTVLEADSAYLAATDDVLQLTADALLLAIAHHERSSTAPTSAPPSTSSPATPGM
ncbi:MAG: TolC family protein [Myxococcaceae bacterium]|nr:TolC family protein [Myxococcaceae bacterium]